MTRYLRELHWPLIWTTLGLMVLGTLFIHSAAYHGPASFVAKQMVWMAVAVAVLFAVPLAGYRTFLSVSYLLYAAAVLLLLFVLIAGQVRYGASRWIHLGPVAVQPSEFAKIATILALANYLGSHFPWEEDRTRVLLKACLIAGVPFLLIVKQPDLGTALLFIPMAGVLLFLWGIRIRVILTSVLGLLVSLPVFWHLLKPYQKERLLVFLDPMRDPLGAGYTAVQSRIAVGSGGLLGKGYLAGTQAQLDFVPEHHTDFIFCVIGEEWGFAGTLLLLFLYGALFRAAFEVMEHTTDVKAKLLVTGVLAVIFSQVFINIGMSFGLMPITGLTLPLVSYGGSSLVTTALALGLLLSIHKERSIF